MDRRDFLQRLGAAGASAALPRIQVPARQQSPATRRTTAPPDVAGHTLVCEFSRNRVQWKVYEDLRARDGALTFVSAGNARVLAKRAEPAFADDRAPFLGLDIEEIGLSGRDLLAEKLLLSGADPDEDQVRAAAPPQGSVAQPGQGRGRWTTFVGTREAYDVTPVYPGGSTRT